MICSSVLVPALMVFANCNGSAAAFATRAQQPQTPTVFAVQDAQRLSDPKLAQIRGGRILGPSDRLTTEVRLREMTSLQATAGQTVDSWWASTGATLIAANLIR